MWEKDPYSGFDKDELHNGLRVSNKYYPGCPFVELTVIIRAGARNDPIGSEGLAHFVEHLVSNNVPGYTHSQIRDFFNTMGGEAKLGATGFDGSSYSFKSPAKLSDLDQAIRIFGEMLVAPVLEKQVEREREVILQEMSRILPWQRERDSLRNRSIYHELPMRRMPMPLGVEESVRTITSEDLQRFAIQTYQTQNIQVVSVGGVRTQHLVQMLSESKFGSGPEGRIIEIAPKYYPTSSVPDPKIERRWKEIGVSNFNKVAYESYCLVPGKMSEPQIFVFQSMLQVALFRELREKRRWVYTFGVPVIETSDTYMLGITAQADPAATPHVEKVVEETLHSLTNDQLAFDVARLSFQNKLRLSDHSLRKIRDVLEQDYRVGGEARNRNEWAQSYSDMKISSIEHILKYFQPQMRWTMLITP